MKSLFSADLLQRIERCAVIAVLVIDRVEHGPPLAKALLAGGIDVMELTLRTPEAIGALQAIRAEVPEMVAGIGTILTAEQVDEVVAADAAFGVAPGFNRRVVEKAQERGLPFAPGVTTASEIEAAAEMGCRELKFFPAQPSGGMAYLSATAAPYAHLGLRFIPLGGLNMGNMADYLKSDLVAAIGGSWIAPRNLIKQEDWSAITDNAAEAKRLIERIKAAS
ncbi:KHG/KDPG aldolase [Novipirellula aureliae]|uniref:2-dehydro-3-deoxy-phosphogluconate aldolase n=1 Tax=Novipirellula aureliae TaxID=2527966 RepID=A0A5C6E6G9_9BACT|nr:bifunctional 4-hydroxy-2-oxoglutarate aldolase/2-dehydro-3-deoxy-phosphogluconate aldolase [Novipirellula aureliae]TWU45253.1 KHG/KDPG aldolase [Novipirellula aureliae]